MWESVCVCVCASFVLSMHRLSQDLNEWMIFFLEMSEVSFLSKYAREIDGSDLTTWHFS